MCQDPADLSDDEPYLFHPLVDQKPRQSKYTCIVVAALLESLAPAPGLFAYPVLAWGTVNLLGLTTQR